MKLALVLLGPLDRRSGGYSYDLDWRDHLSERGHEVAVWSLPSGAAAARKALKQFLSTSPELVVFDALVHADVGAWVADHAPLKRCPWVALLHHLAWLEDPEPTGATAGKQEAERRFLEAMDGYLFNSDDTRRSVADLRGPGAAFKPSLVNRPPLRLPATVPTRLPGSAALLFLANLTPRKNLHGLLTALGLLARRRPELRWTLTVAGQSDFDPAYTRLCHDLARREHLEDKVTWAGRVDGADLEALWAKSDLLTVPSFHEGWGMVYAEALARGVVPLTGDRGGGPEAVGQAGLRADPRSPQALADTVAAFLTHPDRPGLALRARRRGEYLAEAGTGFQGLDEFLTSLVTDPEFAGELDFDRYLEAKASVDTRSLHPAVLAAAFAEGVPARVLELGGGTGTMARRLRGWGRVGPRTRYELVDQRAEGLELAQRLGGDLFDPGFLVTRQDDLQGLLDEAPGEDQAPDLVIAHAVLDLFDPGPTARGLARLGARRYWLTHIFDGHTVWEPTLDLDLDTALVSAYHRTMDERALAGGGGSSRSGREWLTALPAAGLTVTAAGSSDWIVRPEGGRYPEAEAVFLTSLLHFFRLSLTGRPDVDQAGLRWWLNQRRRQIENAQAVFVAHQLDLVAQR